MRDRGRRPCEEVQIDDAYLGGEQHGGKRGRGSENKAPLVAPVQVTGQADQPVVLRLSLMERFPKDELARWTQKHLEPGTKVRSDGLVCFKESRRRVASTIRP